MSQGGEILLEATGVAKTFGGLKAVDDVSFSLRAGIITTLVGPNGAGKTTLFNLMTGHLAPDRGEVTWLGKSILGLPHWKIARLGIGRSFQDLKLFANMTVEENIETFTERGSWLWQSGGASARSARRARVDATLAATGLDRGSYERFLSLLRNEVREGVTICIIEHNLDIVQGISDRIAFLDQGRLLAEGDPKTILSDPALAAIYFGERAA